MTTLPTLDPSRPSSPKRLADALRVLAMDAVQAANSGHPGMPMGMADIAEVVWGRHLRHNPANPDWAGRDRFVLSNGHGSMLLYGLLHLTGYDLPASELACFRQLHSLTPGHPEWKRTPGVETSTGPLGQGLANAVGMALAEKLLAREFNTPDHQIVDHHTYVFLGDGCMMEGLSHEVAALAGTWGLGKLICLYDDNGISIDGEMQNWFTQDVPAIYRGYGWHVIEAVDGHDTPAIDAAVQAAKAQTQRPTLICCRTVIGQGAATKAGDHNTHGAPLGVDEIAATREALGWPHAPFVIPGEVRAAWDARTSGAENERVWNEQFTAYQVQHPEQAAEFLRRLSGELSADWAVLARELISPERATGQALAMRRASQRCLERLVGRLPGLLGGSADLTPSNLTQVPAHQDLDAAAGSGNYIHYGVREFGMCAIMNGLALHGGYIPYGGTFLIFSDYARNAIRMAALMGLRVIYVLTHDSIGVGEDGPTHQPIEQAAALRLIPNLSVWRPADEIETGYAWKAALEQRDGPTALLLSRQNLAPLPRPAQPDQIACGGYVLVEAEGGNAQVILLSCGSELGVTLEAAQILRVSGVRVRVVSMPSTSVFDRQNARYREAVLPLNIPAVAVEAAHVDGWRKYVGRSGAVVGLSGYGESAPPADLYKLFGITAANVAAQAQHLLATQPPTRTNNGGRS